MDSIIPNKGRQEGGSGPILVTRRERETLYTTKICKFEWTITVMSIYRTNNLHEAELGEARRNRKTLIRKVFKVRLKQKVKGIKDRNITHY